MKILVTMTSDSSFKKEVEFDHLEDCIRYLYTCPEVCNAYIDFMVAVPSEVHYASLFGKYDFVVEIYDDYRE